MIRRLARWIIDRLAPADWRESIDGDLDEGLSPRAAVLSALRLRWERGRSLQDDASDGGRRMARACRTEARHALRSLLARPATSLVALATLTVGLGVTTSVFSLANWLLFRPIPGIGAAGDLVTIRFQNQGRVTYPASGPDVGDFAAVPALAAAAGVNAMTVHVARLNGGDPRRLDGEYVTANYFEVIGQRLTAGRGFSAADQAAGPGARVAIVGASFARAWFGGTRAAVRERILVDRLPFEIVGVAAEGFHGPSRTGTADIWIPITSQAAMRVDSRSTGLFYTLIGRLRPGATLVQARDELDAIRANDAVAFPGQPRYTRASVVVDAGLAPPVWERDGLDQTFALVWGVAALLLVLTCANVGNLMLARSIERAGEISTRQALGASRGDVALGLLLEALWLSVAGGAIALAAARLVTTLLESTVIIRNMPVLGPVDIDWRVFGGAFLVSAGVAVTAGLLPAVLGSRADLAATLRGAGRGQTPARRRARTTLVVAQVAVTVTLAIAGLLLLRSMRARAAVPLGFRTEDVLAFSVDPGMGVKTSTEAQDVALFRAVLDGVRGVPGVRAAGLAWIEPFKPIGGGAAMRPADSPGLSETRADSNPISPGFFDAIGLSRLEGRDFTPAETFHSDEHGGGVIVVNRALAQALFGDTHVAGRRVLMSYPEGRVRTIVGVVDNSRTRGLAGPAPPIMYEPFGQTFTAGWATVHLRLSQPPAVVVPRVAAVVRSIDPMMPIYDVELLGDSLARFLAEDTMVMRITVAFAAVALILAGVGLYGVLAREVEERRQEFGLRLALGARPAAIARLVSVDALRALVVGVVAGSVLTVWLVRLIESRLFGVTKGDPTSIASAIGLVVAATVLAALPAARRAGRVDPADILRQ